jgi:hypothetical protein
VKLPRFNMPGRQVAVPIDARHGAGTQVALFNAGSLASVVYLHRIETGNDREIGAMLLPD